MNKWILGARPRTLPAAIAPVMVATALAGNEFQPSRAALALLVSLSLQIGVNFANDYSDGIRGTDTDRIGPTRLTASGLASPNAVKSAAYISFLIGAIAGLILAMQTSWWLILIGGVAILAAWGYTGGQNPYGYSGFGEISVFIFFGLVATMGTYYVQSEEVTFQSALASMPIGALACAILAVNNIRDREKDFLVGKHTLAVRLGDRYARYFFVLLILFAHVTAIATILPWGALTLVVAPISLSICRKVLKGLHGRDLIPILGATGRLQLLFAIVFSIALVCGQRG
jgi:1,4-dihydroxy-2-naphthoate octaprenyltransferase